MKHHAGVHDFLGRFTSSKIFQAYALVIVGRIPYKNGIVSEPFSGARERERSGVILHWSVCTETPTLILILTVF
jgi:hypothetical protein